MYNFHPIVPKFHFSFYLNCVGKMGNGKGLGNFFLCTEKLFCFSIWKYILVLKYPMFLPVDFQLLCTIFSRLKTPSNLNYPVLGHFSLLCSFAFKYFWYGETLVVISENYPKFDVCYDSMLTYIFKSGCSNTIFLFFSFLFF